MRKFLRGANPNGSKHYIYHLNKKPDVLLWQIDSIAHRMDIQYPMSCMIGDNVYHFESKVYFYEWRSGFLLGWEKSREDWIKKVKKEKYRV